VTPLTLALAPDTDAIAATFSRWSRPCHSRSQALKNIVAETIFNQVDRTLRPEKCSSSDLGLGRDHPSQWLLEITYCTAFMYQEAEAMDRVAILKDGIGQVDTSPQCPATSFVVGRQATPRRNEPSIGEF
jgi:hypothetical protein